MVVYDAHIYEIQFFGGLVRYWNNIFHELILKDFQFKLIYHKTPRFLPSWLKDYLIISNNVIDSKFFHSTYYTLPAYKTKQILTVHDTICEDFTECFEINKSYLNSLKRKKECMIMADHIIAVSQFTKNRLIELYNVREDKISVIHHGIDHVYENEPEYKLIKFAKPYILYVGGRASYKNFKLLLSVFFKDSFYKEFDLFVVGSEEYYLQEEQEIINNYRNRECVKLLGQVNDNQLDEIYRNCTICVITSLIEGFGFSSLETLKRGKRLVCSDIEIFKETCLRYPIYFAPNSEIDLSNKIKIGIINNSLNIEAIEYTSKFTWKNTVSKMLELYNSMLS